MNRTFYNELTAILSRRCLWQKLSVLSLKLHYKKSLLGASWIVISFFLKITALSFVYSKLMGKSIDNYLPYLGLGYLVWTLISALVSESMTVFTRAASYIVQMRLPLSVYVMSDLYKELISFSVNFIIFVFVLTLLGIYPTVTWGVALLGLLMIFWIGFSLSFILGFLVCRYQDLLPLINSFMMIAFLVSPVLWHSDLLDATPILLFNPFYHALEVVRTPIVDNVIPTLSLIVMFISGVILMLLAVLSYKRNVSKFVYWLD